MPDLTRPTLVLLALLVAPSRPVDACMNGVERVVDYTNQAIRNAESVLAAGQYQRAAGLVLAAFPRALELERREAKQSLFERGQRVLAVALVRSRGALDLKAAKVRATSPPRGKTQAEREVGLAWAAAALRLHHARGLGGVVLTAELAEALAERPAEADEAHTILKDLAARDLVPTARAWATLAALEKDRGDDAAAVRAVAACKEIAADDRLCEVVTDS